MKHNIRIIQVNLQDRSYPILIGSNLFGNPDLLSQYIPQQQVCFVSNETIAPLYLPLLKTSFTQKKQAEIILPDGEQYKIFGQVEKIFTILLREHFDKGMVLCAVGGGVIGDMTGFAAACYRRGVDFIQFPTTLLSQVDASIGGKTGVNHALGKNMIGTIYQPKAVIIDVDTLNTLPEREYCAGLAEVVKYGLIQDRALFEWLVDRADQILARDRNTLMDMMGQCCSIKAKIVSVDEKETGVRAILNFGHTFAHALETATDYGHWLHGEAVAIGMVAAAFMSLHQGSISQEEFDSIVWLLQKFNLPVHQSKTDIAAYSRQKDQVEENNGSEIPDAKRILKSLMLQDKKIINQQLKLILLKKVGEAIISTDFSERLMDQALEFSLQNRISQVS